VSRLVAEGMIRPSIRAVLYRLMKAQPGWSKAHYGTLCTKTGEWRDAGLFDYGILSDDSGDRSRPYSRREIAERIKTWQAMRSASLPRDGFMRALLVEHESLVDQVQYWCEGQALVVSSAGQIRRENLWTAVREWKALAEELGAKGIRVHALVDRDRGGQDIFEAHRRWFATVADLRLEFFGITDAQLSHSGLALDEDWQIDGLIALDVAWWRLQVRNLLLGRERRR
jgi:hypothetical protein